MGFISYDRMHELNSDEKVDDGRKLKRIIANIMPLFPSTLQTLHIKLLTKIEKSVQPLFLHFALEAIFVIKIVTYLFICT